MLLGDVQTAIRSGQYLSDKHANKAALADALEITRIWQALCQPSAVVVEDYSGDPRGPSALIYCEVQGRPVHVVVAYPSTLSAQQLGYPALAFMITCYCPDDPKHRGKWSADYKQRI